MHDPDDDGPSSGGDWDMCPSPTISSLSSFSPEDYSFISIQQYHHQEPESQSDPETPQKPSGTSPRHEYNRFEHQPTPPPRQQPSPQRQQTRSPPQQPTPQQRQPPPPPPPPPPPQSQQPRPHLQTPPPTSSPNPRTLKDALSPSFQVRSSSLGLGLHMGRPIATSVGMGMGAARGMGMGVGVNGMGVSPLASLHHRPSPSPEPESGSESRSGRAKTVAGELLPAPPLPPPVQGRDGGEQGRVEEDLGRDEKEQGWSGEEEELSRGGKGVGEEEEDTWDRDRDWGLPGRGYERNGNGHAGMEGGDEVEDGDSDHDGEHSPGYSYGYDGTREDESGYMAEGEEVEAEGTGPPLDPGRVELMERLCDLVERISSARVGGGMEADVLEVLHDKIDEMEGLLTMAEDAAAAEDTAIAELGGEDERLIDTDQEEDGMAAEETRDYENNSFHSEATSRASDRRFTTASPSRTASPAKQDVLGLASPSPWLATSFRFSDLSLSQTGSNPELAAATNEALEAAKRAAQAQDELARRVAREAEELNREMVKIVRSLQERKEESEHLHAILVERAEGAANRILDLEKEASDLEDDILSNESELRHLRLQLRAVETLCHEFVPPDADPDLVRAIENWKADWRLVRDRMLDRKRDRRDRRVRLRRAGCLLENGEEDGESTLTLGGLSMSVGSLMGGSPRKSLVGGSPRKGF